MRIYHYINQEPVYYIYEVEAVYIENADDGYKLVMDYNIIAPSFDVACQLAKSLYVTERSVYNEIDFVDSKWEIRSCKRVGMVHAAALPD